MALIHRCDRCGTDHQSGGELASVTVGDDSRSVMDQLDHNRHDLPKLPLSQDLCSSCVIFVLEAMRKPAKKCKRCGHEIGSYPNVNYCPVGDEPAGKNSHDWPAASA